MNLIKNGCSVNMYFTGNRSKKVTCKVTQFYIEITYIVNEVTFRCYSGDKNGVAQKITRLYFSDNNRVSRKIKKAYVGNNDGIAAAAYIEGRHDLFTDFVCHDNGNNTYTIVGWNGTLNGARSTEFVIPDDSRIIL
jgi:hypothetical protein